MSSNGDYCITKFGWLTYNPARDSKLVACKYRGCRGDMWYKLTCPSSLASTWIDQAIHTSWKGIPASTPPWVLSILLNIYPNNNGKDKSKSSKIIWPTTNRKIFRMPALLPHNPSRSTPTVSMVQSTTEIRKICLKREGLAYKKLLMIYMYG